MNCANHPDRERVAFCQNCGKPLCSECIRTSGTSIFCEPCFAARTAAPGSASGAGYGPGASGYVPGAAGGVAGEPNPALAALLGFIPGVGAMYNGQYAKGLVHLVIFAFLVTLSHDVHIFGLFIAGWICYMVIEAHHTARARRDGTPLPNPFGLNDIAERLGFMRGGATSAGYASTPPYTPPPSSAPPYPPPTSAPFTASQFVADAVPNNPPPSNPYTPPTASWGAPPNPAAYGYTPVPPVTPIPPMPEPNVTYSQRFPVGAAWLIGLGCFFLLANMGFIHGFPARIFFPLLMIGGSVWIFVRKMTAAGYPMENDGTPAYHLRLTRAIGSAMWVAVTGLLWLLDETNVISWSHSWPIFLIAGGIFQVFRRSAYAGYTATGPYAGTYPDPYAGSAYTAPAPPVTTTEIVPTTSIPDDREGR